jgi:drug/metabolite transporter (DMT)-like permease
VALLYRALAIGTMSIVAPTTAVCAAAVPVLAALALGERPGVRAAIGIVMAVMAIALLSRGESTRQLTSVRGFCPSRSLKHRPSPLEKRGLHHQTQGSSGVDSPATPPEPNRQRRAGLGLALLSGIAVGLFFLCLARTSPDAGMWPLIVGRSVSVPLFGAMALASRPRIRMPLAVARTAVSGGTLDMLANALYLVATRYGPLSLVATLASLYPASTVLLARVTLGERLTQWQSLGVGCALAAVVLIVSA